MTDTDNDQEDLQEIIANLLRDSDAANILRLASNVEEYLSRLLANSMPNISNSLRSTLFSGYGPLSNFSAKIDIAYAFGHINANLKRDLHAIRGIRNKIAHSTGRAHFNDSEMIKLLHKFNDYKPKECPDIRDRVRYITNKCTAAIVDLGRYGDLISLATALRSSGEPTEPSPDKSG